jgi:hypothetical protein
MASAIAFLYKWVQVSTGMWYVGSRTAQNCHLKDGYICSSKKVKPLIIENQNDWHREILVIGPPKYIADLERKYLTAIDAKNDTFSFNEHNGDGIFSQTGKTPWNKGKESPFKGIPRSTATKIKISNSHKNKEKSEDHKKNMSASRKGKIPWNKGIPDNDDVRATKKEAAKNRKKSDLFIEAIRNAAKRRIGKTSPIKGKAMPSSHGQKISIYQKGRPKVKQICRLIDKKEMSLSHFNQWINRQSDNK